MLNPALLKSGKISSWHLQQSFVGTLNSLSGIELLGLHFRLFYFINTQRKNWNIMSTKLIY